MDVAGGRRVLVVDDDERVRTVVCWQLEADGFTVTQAGDGAAALQSIDREPPDVLVLDLTLPRVGGLDVLRRVRRDEQGAAGPALPVIVLSGRSGETDRIVGLDLGADDYLVKPFSPVSWPHGCARCCAARPASPSRTPSTSPDSGSTRSPAMSRWLAYRST